MNQLQVNSVRGSQVRRLPRKTPGKGDRRARTGAAVVELAILLPLLIFLFVIAADFARIYYFSLTLQNCARSGALYASDPAVANESPYSSYQHAALSDATNLTPQPTISKSNGTDAIGRPYVEVKASYTFNTITALPGVPNQVNLQRSVKMYIAAISPDAD